MTAIAVDQRRNRAGDRRTRQRAVRGRRSHLRQPRGEPGDLFVAMKGKVDDGHDFVAGALPRGAVARDRRRKPVDGPHVLVADTAEALDALGALRRATVEPAMVIGVTGSVGKTGVKEALSPRSTARARARPSLGQELQQPHRRAVEPCADAARQRASRVFEMGMNHAGEIAALTRLVRPHVAIVTAIAPAHIENLGARKRSPTPRARFSRGSSPAAPRSSRTTVPHRDRLVKAAAAHAARDRHLRPSGDADVTRCRRRAVGQRRQAGHRAARRTAN